MIITTEKLGSEVLLIKSKEVVEFDNEFDRKLENLVATFKFYDPAGLSAIQIGYDVRMFAGRLNGKMEIFINPELLWNGEETTKDMEGCLSAPGIFIPKIRFKDIRVKYKNIAYEDTEKLLSGIESRIFQHELDHLNGILFTDNISNTQKQIILTKIAKAKKTNKWDFDAKVIEMINSGNLRLNQ